MSRILVTGGTGSLGRELVSRLKQTGNIVRVMSRSTPRPGQSSGVEWAQADLKSGRGLAEAVRDVKIIINAATSSLQNTYAVDVVGAKTMLEQARAAGVAHVIHISIVGIEKIHFPYYQHKVEAEKVVMEAGVPYSILRATQFHSLADIAMQPMKHYFFSPFFLLSAQVQLQLIDPGEVADYLLPYVTEKAVGRIPDVGGPEILNLSQIAQMWLEARQMKRPMVHIPLLRGLSEGCRKGYNTCPESRYGKITWADYLQRRYGSAQPVAPTLQKDCDC